MEDKLFAKTYNKAVLAALVQKYGSFEEHHAEVIVTTGPLMRMVHSFISKKNRRGEVIMVVPDGNGRIWLHAKSFYPDGVYRLLTGGLKPNESPQSALKREVYEETGFKVKVDCCLAVITYNLVSPEGTVPFVSYVFLTSPGSGQPQPTDPGEDISGFLAATPKEIGTTGQQLTEISGEFREWGVFRAIGHHMVANALAEWA
jgi:8-oxo-dGTP pyrophosphatase MutT (NUDIX family)